MRLEFKKARKKMKLTQKQLAEITGMASISVRKIENGERSPTLQNASKLSKALETDVEKLFPDIFLPTEDTKCIEKEKVNKLNVDQAPPTTNGTAKKENELLIK